MHCFCAVLYSVHQIKVDLRPHTQLHSHPDIFLASELPSALNQVMIPWRFFSRSLRKKFREISVTGISRSSVFGDCAYFWLVLKIALSRILQTHIRPAHGNDREGEVMCMEISLKLDFLRM